METTSTTDSNAEMLGHIERLEAIILQPFSVETQAKYVSDDSHISRRLALTPSAGGVVVSDIHQNRDEHSQLLENVGTREDLLVRDSNFDVLQGLLPFHNALTYE